MLLLQLITSMHDKGKDSLAGCLLVKSILHKKHSLVQTILESNYGITHDNILTQVDFSGYSPISRTLFSSNKNILRMVKQYINSHKTTIKLSTLEGEDFQNIITVLEFSQFENMPIEKCLEKYIKPLYNESSIKQIEDILINGEARDPFEGIEFNSEEEFDFDSAECADWDAYVNLDYAVWDCYVHIEERDADINSL